MADNIHSIKAVARQTGLSPHVIRVWEKRYQAVSPARTPTQRRLYSDQEVQRLMLLKEATEAGHSIGCIARLSNERLKTLSPQPNVPQSAAVEPLTQTDAIAPKDPTTIIEAATNAIADLNAGSLEMILAKSSVAFGHRGMVLKIIAPLTQRIGELWEQGVFKVCHEHLASAVIRTALANSIKLHPPHPSAPALVVSTPAGQIHELGASMVAASAAQLGWRVTYLGPNLPANEIAAAAEQSHARAVALSVVYPEDDPHVADELSQLRQLLPAGMPILVGGRASASYGNTLQNIGAIAVTDLLDLHAQLELLRRQRPVGNDRNN